MKSGDTVLEIDPLVNGIGYAILTTDSEKPLLRLHLSQNDFDKMGDVPLTLVGATVKVFAFNTEAQTLHVAFIRADNALVTWQLEDPTGNGFKESFEGNIAFV